MSKIAKSEFRACRGAMSKEGQGSGFLIRPEFKPFKRVLRAFWRVFFPCLICHVRRFSKFTVLTRHTTKIFHLCQT